MQKITRFQDIVPFTRSGSWECDFSLESAVQQVDKREKELGLNTDPDFQRAHVWTEDQQVAWLEFFLRGGKTGRVLYFNDPGWSRKREVGQFVMVDGKQRLQAMRRFIGNEIQVFGSYHKEYTDRLRIHYTIKLHVNDLPTRADVLRWYLEFNSGGTPHSTDEITRVRELLVQEENA